LEPPQHDVVDGDETLDVSTLGNDGKPPNPSAGHPFQGHADIVLGPTQVHRSRHHTIDGKSPGVAIAPEREGQIAIGGDADDSAARPEHDQTAAPGLAHPAAGVRRCMV
jgi:hypothetical protein